jgi:acid phosphatase type 7
VMRQRGALLLALTVAAGCSWDATSPTPLPAVSLRVRGTGADSGGEAVLVGAGDIAVCGSPGAEATARLLDGIRGTVFTAGDNAYPVGGADDFRDCYDRTWGRHKNRTHPTPGNHDYDSPGAAPYFDYFGANAGPRDLGYYSYRLEDWQVYALNSNVAVDAASAQVQWLRQELAANPSLCSVAVWHHPLFSSGSHGDNPAMKPLWDTLHEAGAEVVIVGHDHLYERFAPQDPDGRLDAAGGIRQFTVGTGGASLTAAVRLHANSDVVWTQHGVLKLTLRADSYTWQFISETGAAADVGGALCH